MQTNKKRRASGTSGVGKSIGSNEDGSQQERESAEGNGEMQEG